jgi:hypothetical protein
MDKRFKAQEKRTRRTKRKQAAEAGETETLPDAHAEATDLEGNGVEATSSTDGPTDPSESS